MRLAMLGSAALVAVSGGPALCAALDDPLSQAVRQTEPLDHGWRFLLADPAGAERPEFEDRSWRSVDLPHDWSIEGPFASDAPAGGAGAFLPAGIGWYRLRFLTPAAAAGGRTSVEFDGIMANSDVWINGTHLGRRPYGYSSFAYDLTPWLRADSAANVIAVRADDSGQPASRWYAGAGIYRHVRLVTTGAVHLERWSTFVTTPESAAGQARVHVHAVAVNQSGLACPVALQIELSPVGGAPAPGGASIAKAVSAGADLPASQSDPGSSAGLDVDLAVSHPALWNPGRPNLYSVVVRLVSNGRVLDSEMVTLGIRDAHFEAATGFWINGRNLKLKGVCLHADGSAFGMAVPLDVWERRLMELRTLGVNALRTAHHPPDPGFLDLCDRLGFLVMDEMFDCWTVAKNPYDYHLYFDAWSQTDVRDAVRRDRNHPSVILWSAGNEIHDTPNAPLAKRILSGLIPVFHENDPTRPVTQALFRPNVSHDYDDGLADLLDVIGTNYRDNELLAAHEARPSRRILGTENHSDLGAWRAVRDHPAYAGQFLWVGIDYLGESRRWPVFAGGGDQAGLLDRTGLPKPAAFQRQSWWLDTPVVHIVRRVAVEAPALVDPGYGGAPLRKVQTVLDDWTPHGPPGHPESVEVYANCASVELMLNGHSLGVRAVDPGGAPTLWTVPFEAGRLRAVARGSGSAMAVAELRTAGQPARILLTPDHKTLRTGWEHVDYVAATIIDSSGIRVPDASDSVQFHVKGPGVLAAVDSADNADPQPFQADKRRAFQGRCFAILRANAASGKVTLTASAQGLPSSRITLTISDSPPRRPYEPAAVP